MAVRGPATLVLVLALANVLYFAWSRGSFAAFGLLPASFTRTEPHRLARQIRPELLQIVEQTAPAVEPLAEAGPATQGATGR